jgi:hypothetical protein
MGITDLMKFRSRRLFTLKLGHVLTPFFWKKHVKRDKEEQLMKKQSAIGQLKEENNGQHDSLMVRGI